MGPTRHDRGGKCVENMASSMLCRWEDVPRRGILLYLPTSLRTHPGAGFVCEVCELTEVRLSVVATPRGVALGVRYGEGSSQREGKEKRGPTTTKERGQAVDSTGVTLISVVCHRGVPSIGCTPFVLYMAW